MSSTSRRSGGKLGSDGRNTEVCRRTAGHRARKGVFITTSNFTRDAEEYVGRIESKIILIDGPTLARLMVDNLVGVSSVRSYDLLKADPDYFTEE